MRYTQDFSVEINKLNSALCEADAVLIGAGAGLSTAAGYTYSGERFHENFGDFEAKYKFEDMYTGGFYPFESPEEFWAYWSRYILLNRYSDTLNPVYENLYEIVKDKNYFVLTTNVDHCFQKSGFDKNRLFYTQGDYGLLQCSVPCHGKTYDNEQLIRQMVAEQKDMKIPSNLIPRCPVCGEPMTTNLRCDDRFVQDDGWYAACDRYNAFVEDNKNSRIVYLELGVGGNTPVIIKYPFWRMTADNKNATYACINLGKAFCPKQISDRAICINGDIADVIEKLKTK